MNQSANQTKPNQTREQFLDIERIDAQEPAVTPNPTQRPTPIYS